MGAGILADRKEPWLRCRKLRWGRAGRQERLAGPAVGGAKRNRKWISSPEFPHTARAMWESTGLGTTQLEGDTGVESEPNDVVTRVQGVPDHRLVEAGPVRGLALIGVPSGP